MIIWAKTIEQTIAFTDETSLAMEHFGKQPLLVEGSHIISNWLFPEDLEICAGVSGKTLAKCILQQIEVTF